MLVSTLQTMFRRRAFINKVCPKSGGTKTGEMRSADVRLDDVTKSLLLRDAQTCTLCKRMTCSRRVLSDLNGDWEADVFFLAEAPGRLGAEKTGIPLFGDRTGDRFDELLDEMQFERRKVFITNAILCNPRDGNGNNSSPKSYEISNCSRLLERTIEIVNPRMIITLGRIALEALRLLCPHDITLQKDVAEIRTWGHRRLVPLYHPGPRTVIHRPWRDQLRDAKRAGKLVRRELKNGGSG
jgi:uracil-DNA glycosylase family 4